jgi:hypothetical protein
MMLMFRLNIICVLLVASFSILFSCQRELSPYDSKGFLLKDSNGNCSQVIVHGVYNKDQQLNDSNYIDVEINISSPGSYNLTTDTVNGYYFNATGTISNTGVVHIKLTGSGKPVIDDTDFFTIKYDTSFCEFAVTVFDTTVHEATFTFEGAPDICANDTVYGSYINNVTLDTNDKVKMNLNVTAVGNYNISTNTVNGYAFSASGTLVSTGLQSVLLTASGIPLQKETDVFTVAAGNSSCNFSVNVLAVKNVAGDDYFPLTANSYWTYDDLIHTGDTLKKTIVDSTFINSDWYKIAREDVAFGGPYNFYYRKSGTTYFEYASPNEYTTFFQYKKPVEADIPLLEENLLTGSTWQSPEYIDTTTTDTITLRYQFSCVDNDATVTLNNQIFAHVYKIQMLPEIKTDNGAYSYTTEEYFFYYAKGIGLIYLKKTLGGFTQQELQIRNWKVF